MTSSRTVDVPPTYRRGLWLVLAAALVWVVVVRLPLVLNAESHLDSDLAVDGLTLLRGGPGTLALALSGHAAHRDRPGLALVAPGARLGGQPDHARQRRAVAFVGLVAATFLLTWRAFGPSVAAWGLVPLAFASTGVIWLSGRITGGHLLAAAWHAGRVRAPACRRWRAGRPRGRPGTRALVRPGFSLDSMFLVTLAGLLPAAAAGWWVSGRSRPRRSRRPARRPAPSWPASGRARSGPRLDPYDAYQRPVPAGRPARRPGGHARILGPDCLPRLFAGHRLPGLQADPDPVGARRPRPLARRTDASPLAACRDRRRARPGVASARRAWSPGASAPRRRSQGAVRLGLLASSAGGRRGVRGQPEHLQLGQLSLPRRPPGPVVDRVRPALRSGWRGGAGRAGGAGVLAIALAALMTLDTARWYARFGWIDARGRPVRKPLDDPALAWLEAHPEVDGILGGYWDVYRLSFLTGGRVQGVPFPVYPDRFPEWSLAACGRPSDVLLGRPSPKAWPFRESALRSGGRVLHQERGSRSCPGRADRRAPGIDRRGCIRVAVAG